MQLGLGTIFYLIEGKQIIRYNWGGLFWHWWDTHATLLSIRDDDSVNCVRILQLCVCLIKIETKLIQSDAFAKKISGDAKI